MLRSAITAGLGCCLGAALALGGEATFTAKPAAKSAGDKVELSFAVSAPTDAEVSILDAGGKVVRHLAAGLLGKNAPEPFKKDSLAQEIAWDRRDDDGKPTAGGAFKARVRLGMSAKLDRILGWDPQALSLNAWFLAVGKDGELFVLDSMTYGGDFSIRVLSRDGKYLRTIAPYPANLPYEKVKGFGPHAFPEKFGIPLVHNAYTANLFPLVSGVQIHNPAVLPDGRLVFVSGRGTSHEQNPPQHLLAINPDGSCPESGCVGPPLRVSYGFVGGDGGAGCYRPTFVAASPDGKQFYVSGLHNGEWFEKETPSHVVFKVAWEDKALPTKPFLGEANEPGADDAHLNGPRGLATDKDGNLLVADQGNGRLAVFDPAGKLLGQTKIDGPEQVVVNRETGEVFVLCVEFRDGKPILGPKSYRIVKLSAGRDGKVLCQTEPAKVGWHPSLMNSGWPVIALDAGAKPPRLWLGVGQKVLYFEDRGTALEPKPNVLTGKGVFCPDTIFADESHGRLYILSKPFNVAGIQTLDLKTGAIGAFNTKGAAEFAVDPAGNVYVNYGYLDTKIARYDPEGKPLPFGAKAELEPMKDVWRQSFTIAPNGDVYVLHGEQGKPMALDVWGPDGSLKRKDAMTNIPDAVCGIGVDAAGNIYLGFNLKKADHPFPDPCMGLLPAKPWYYWRHGEREWPWRGSYMNHYLFYWGSIFKFKPEGGKWTWAGRDAKPIEPPAGAVGYKSAALNRDYYVQGALWQYQGFSPCPQNRLDGGGGDDTCTCWGGRFATDAFGRCFVPDCLRFSVAVIDANANEVLRFGKYGNMDSRGAGSPIPQPEIPVGWVAHLALGEDRVYLSDRMNRRVTVVRLTCAAEKTCPLP